MFVGSCDPFFFLSDLGVFLDIDCTTASLGGDGGWKCGARAAKSPGIHEESSSVARLSSVGDGALGSVK